MFVHFAACIAGTKQAFRALSRMSDTLSREEYVLGMKRYGRNIPRRRNLSPSECNEGRNNQGNLHGGSGANV
jgi:hypothetical protein